MGRPQPDRRHRRLTLGVRHVMSASVITADACFALGGASQQTNNTAELTSIIALQFLILSEAVPRRSQVCTCFDSLHGADVCLGSVQSRTNVRLGVNKPKLRLRVQLSHIAPHVQPWRECGQ